MPITDALPEMKRELRFFPASNDSPRTLSRVQVDFFNANGYLCPLDVFTPQEAEEKPPVFRGPDGPRR